MVVILLLGLHPHQVRGESAGLPGHHFLYLPLISKQSGDPQPGTRLVVFEGFYNPDGLACRAAGLVVDQLAADYAGAPVVFLEHPINNAPLTRISRFYLASSVTAVPPLVMIDSGDQVTDGILNYFSEYKSMVDRALIRAPLVDVQATWRREGNRVFFSVSVINRSGATLSLLENAATVHALVYEGAKIGVTSRYVRSAVSASITPGLAPGGAATFALQTEDLNGVDWNKLHFLALVDYNPGGVAQLAPYDLLQAAVALPSPAFGW